MPIYEYICKDCKHEFEALVRNSTSLPAEGCPECHSLNLQRKLSTFAAKTPTRTAHECPHNVDCPKVSHPSGCCCGCHHH